LQYYDHGRGDYVVLAQDSVAPARLHYKLVAQLSTPCFIKTQQRFPNRELFLRPGDSLHITIEKRADTADHYRFSGPDGGANQQRLAFYRWFQQVAEDRKGRQLNRQAYLRLMLKRTRENVSAMDSIRPGWQDDTSAFAHALAVKHYYANLGRLLAYGPSLRVPKAETDTIADARYLQMLLDSVRNLVEPLRPDLMHYKD
jgi:hypothetical protein